MTVNIDTGSMLKGLREAGCRITTICKCKGYGPLAVGVVNDVMIALRPYCIGGHAVAKDGALYYN